MLSPRENMRQLKARTLTFNRSGHLPQQSLNNMEGSQKELNPSLVIIERMNRHEYAEYEKRVRTEKIHFNLSYPKL